MPASSIRPVILCGGSGTRLWPLSRQSLPKQFAPLLGGKSLLQATFERVQSLSADPIWTVASESHRFLVRDAAAAAKVKAKHILEPVGRNTAAAMAAAALQANADQLLLFLPADHHVPDAMQFIETVLLGVDAAETGALVTFGVAPSHPHTGYGYIQASASAAEAVRPVQRFVEKPNAEVAAEYVLSGEYFWNAGIFLVRADALLNALREHAPDILSAVQKAIVGEQADGDFLRLDAAAFAMVRSESIDYAVLEHHHKVCMVPFTGVWSDVGSWNAVAELTAGDIDQNRVVGNGMVHHARNTYVHAPHRPVVALGTEDLLVVDTTDAVLVAAKSHAEEVKQVVANLQQRGLREATEHRHAARPWGEYDSISEGHRFKVKRITVKPGASLSLQMHHHRAEHWIVVQGTARVMRGDEVFLLSENQSTYIPIGEKHRLENPGTIPLEIIEVQSGSYLGEDDIQRYDDYYGRAP